MNLMSVIQEVLAEEQKTNVSKAGSERVSKKIGEMTAAGECDDNPEQCAAIAYSMEEKGELAEMNIVYENRVLKLIYGFPGDEVNRIEDVVIYRGQEWTIKRIGPIADKSTIGKLVDAMVAALRNEKDWRDDKKTEEEIDALRPSAHL